jgi:hypothetical protein
MRGSAQDDSGAGSRWGAAAGIGAGEGRGRPSASATRVGSSGRKNGLVSTPLMSNGASSFGMTSPSIGMTTIGSSGRSSRIARSKAAGSMS